MSNLGKAFLGGAAIGAGATIAGNYVNRARDPLAPGFFKRTFKGFWSTVLWLWLWGTWIAGTRGQGFFGGLAITVTIAFFVACIALCIPTLAQRVPRWVLGMLPFAGGAVRKRERATLRFIRDVAVPMLTPPQGIHNFDFRGDFNAGPAVISILAPGVDAASLAHQAAATAHQLGFALYRCHEAVNAGWIVVYFANRDEDFDLIN